MRHPFTLYKEKTKSGTFWYVRFWDETSQKYKHSRATGVLVEGKKERRYEAEEAARTIYKELTSSQNHTVPETNKSLKATSQSNTTTAIAKMPLGPVPRAVLDINQ